MAGEYRFPTALLSARRGKIALVAKHNKADHVRKEVLSVLNFIREEEGQGLVEYALIIAVIAIAVIVAMLFLRGQIQNIFSNIGNNLT